MNPDRIRDRIPGARLVGKAVFRGWTLKERLYADIERSRGGRVEGVLYFVTTKEKNIIRRTPEFESLRAEARRLIAAYDSGADFDYTVSRLAVVGAMMEALLA